MNFFDSNNCGNSFHYFARDCDDRVRAYHSTDQVCESAEFNLEELLNDELPRMELKEQAA